MTSKDGINLEGFYEHRNNLSRAPHDPVRTDYDGMRDNRERQRYHAKHH